jgi:hypothetical protein
MAHARRTSHAMARETVRDRAPAAGAPTVRCSGRRRSEEGPGSGSSEGQVPRGARRPFASRATRCGCARHCNMGIELAMARQRIGARRTIGRYRLPDAWSDFINGDVLPLARPGVMQSATMVSNAIIHFFRSTHRHSGRRDA